MKRTIAAPLFVVLLLAAGCGTAPAANDPGGTPPCGGTASCPDQPITESVCLEHLAADVLDDDCGVFVAGFYGFGDDANPGTKEAPVFSVQHGIDLARVGRGRVFVCNDGFLGPVVLPSGVDLFGGWHCRFWVRDARIPVSSLRARDDLGPIVTVEPAIPGDAGTADGISTIADFLLDSWGPIGLFARSNTAVELLRSELRADYGVGGRSGKRWPWPNQAATGPDGLYGGNTCSGAIVAGGAAVTNPCDGGMASIGGRGGDGRPNDAEDGDDGAPLPVPNPTLSGIGGAHQVEGVSCASGHTGISGAQGAAGAAGEGIGRISEAGYEPNWAADGGRGMPGQGGGGGGGRHDWRRECVAASLGGPGGGGGGAGGCGGRGGKGGQNGKPSIGLLVLHAKVTVRDSLIVTEDGGDGGPGGEPEQGGKGGRGAPGGIFENGTSYSCEGGNGGIGGYGGYGGGGRGGDSIGIAYLDEDQLTLEGVTFELGNPGKGGLSWPEDPAKAAAPGVAVEMLRFPE